MPAGPLGARQHLARATSVVAAILLVVAAPAPAARAQGCPGPGECERPVPPWERQQRPTLALAAAGLYSSFDGAALRPLGDGFGVEAQAMLGVGQFALGVGYQRTSHSVTAGAAGDAVYHGAFVEPRLSLDLGYGAFTPYVAGRVARLTRTRDEGGDADVARRGVQFGGGAGVLVAVSPRLRLDVGATYSGLRFDETDAGGAGRATGRGLLLRAGLSVDLTPRTR